jgi:hypothetical protein
MAKTCVICGSPELVRSHLLPAAFGRDVKGGGQNFWIGRAGRIGKTISQSGIFERFLCQTHENAIHEYEEYAIEFVRGFKLTDGEVHAQVFHRDNTDNEALIRFVCSVLWRFHHSERKETEDVDLGEWEPNLRDVTFGGSVNQAPDVSIFAIHQTIMPKDAFLLAPTPGAKWNLRTLQFSANGLVFTTKLAHEDWPQPIQRTVLNQTPDWITGVVRPFGEREWQDMRAAAAWIKLSAFEKEG